MQNKKCAFALTTLATLFVSQTAFATITGQSMVDKTIMEDQSTSITLAVMDDMNKQLTFRLAAPPSYGIATVNPNSSSVQYQPSRDFNSTLTMPTPGQPDLFIVEAKDPDGNLFNVTVRVTVQPVNDMPTANVGTAVTNEDEVAQIDLRPLATDVDGDMLTFSITQQPQNGMITGNAPNFVYRPKANYAGTDTISYRVEDGKGGMASSSVTITINPVNDPPEINDAVVNTEEDMDVSINLMATDPENDQVTFTITQQPANGTLMGTAPSFQYRPNPNFVGSDSFKYKANDGKVDSMEKTITINVGNNNDAPEWAAPTPDDMAVININEGDAFTLTLKADDPDGDTLTYGIEGRPDGAMFDSATGVMTWNPDYEDKGEYMLTLTVKDAGMPLMRQVTLKVNIVDEDGDFLPLTLEQKLGLNPKSKDSDGDTISDNDEVGTDWNSPLDSNNNGVIDALDQDSDSDTIPDAQEAGDTSIDTVPVDTDGDLIPDYRDTDSDSDTIEDANDNCKLKRNKDQLDTDGDGDGDKCDDDIDNDGIPNVQDSCPDQAAMTANGCEKRAVKPKEDDEGCMTANVSHRGQLPGGMLLLLIGGVMVWRRRR